MALTDLMAIAFAYLTALAGIATFSEASINIPSWFTVVLLVAAGPFWLGAFASYGLYEHDRHKISVASSDEVGSIFHALVVGSLVIVGLDELVQQVSRNQFYGAGTAVLFVVSALVFVPVFRGALRSFVFPRISRPRRALIVGSGVVAGMVWNKLRSRPEYGLDVVGFLDGDDPSSPPPGPLLGSPSDVARVVAEYDIDHVIMAFSKAGHEEMLEVVRQVRHPDLQISIVPRYFEIFTSHATFDDIEGVPIVSLPPIRLGSSARALKRVFDLAIAGTLTVLFAPVMAAIAVAVRLDSKGPAIYAQPRRGRNGSVFNIYKFRSMELDAESRRGEVLHLNEVDGPLFKVKGEDPRVTRVGRFLRRTSLDELPQLFNVLRGNMSLVGPRPFVLYEADEITGWANRRMDMTPGITGVWQTMGRNDIPYDEMVKLDYLYVTNWSLWWDFKILCQTVPSVLRRHGAY